jgi:hypothetical protein
VGGVSTARAPRRAAPHRLRLKPGEGRTPPRRRLKGPPPPVTNTGGGGVCCTTFAAPSWTSSPPVVWRKQCTQEGRLSKVWA